MIKSYTTYNTHIGTRSICPKVDVLRKENYTAELYITDVRAVLGYSGARGHTEAGSLGLLGLRTGLWTRTGFPDPVLRAPLRKRLN
ncbi:hypothetical protein EVAR_5691_1 [Eumeta japonica]|uniref:Uncharacterized protein n=1 Tax=Eumeta variegata TaxID=151549 RepID=A0A4C1T784_EUMVA|nr:hypothetical protein EVAR_5691_1 [Eumeta japonica]